MKIIAFAAGALAAHQSVAHPLMDDASQASAVPNVPSARLRDGPVRFDPIQPPTAIRGKIELTALPAIEISGVSFEGAHPPAVVASTVQPFIGRTVSREVLQKIANALTDAYKASSVALFTIVIPDQSFDDGVVRVQVAEGHVEAVVLSGETEGYNLQRLGTFAERLTTDQPTRRSTMERTLTLIGETPGLKVQSSLAVGSAPKSVRLNLELDHQRPTVTFGFDNRTAAFIEDGQVSASAKTYRLLRYGDETRLNLGAAINFQDYLYIDAGHSTPVGVAGARAGLSAGWLKSRPRNSIVDGKALYLAGNISFPVIRSYRSYLTLSGALDAINSDNAAFGSIFATERTRAARFSAELAHTNDNNIVQVEAQLAHGIDAFSAATNDPLTNPGFFKELVEVAYQKTITDRFFLRMKAAAQWSGDRLPVNEQFSVGGDRYGRAFEVGLVSFDRGLGASLEFATAPITGGFFSKSELYAFSDYAQGTILSRTNSPKYNTDIGSYGGGVRFKHKKNAMLELEYALPFDIPYPEYETDWRFSVRWQLQIKS